MALIPCGKPKSNDNGEYKRYRERKIEEARVFHVVRHSVGCSPMGYIFINIFCVIFLNKLQCVVRCPIYI